jgi:hypothetical protein
VYIDIYIYRTVSKYTTDMLCYNLSMFSNWRSIIVSNLSVQDEGYSRNVSCTLNLISTFLFFFNLQISEFEEKYQNISRLVQKCVLHTKFFKFTFLFFCNLRVSKFKEKYQFFFHVFSDLGNFLPSYTKI